MEAFRQYVSDQVGKFVQLERSGPEACQGWLFYVGRDYVTLYGVDGSSLHLPLHHIRSVTAFQDPGPEYPPPTIAAEERPESFDELLARHVGQGVRLNHAGPEITVGTLISFTDDFLLLEIAPDFQVCHARFHLRSFCLFTACESWSEGAGTFTAPDNPDAAFEA